MPRETVELYRLVTADRLSQALALWQRLLPAQLFFWSHDYNPSIKAATNLAGRNVGDCRKPQQPLAEADMAILRKAMKSISPSVTQAAQ
jgi:4-hydroxy-tetrahydrodipicolinate synthase